MKTYKELYPCLMQKTIPLISSKLSQRKKQEQSTYPFIPTTEK